MIASHKVIANSVVMYLKMILSIGITFYSTRLVLFALGVNDFGVFNLVAGSISLLGFFNGSMSNTVQRYLAFELGGSSLQRLREVFNISLSLNVAIAFLLCLVLQVFGYWAFEHFFVISPTSLDAAKVAYQLMIVVTMVTTVMSPFNAAFNAHEDLALLAVVDFVESCLKLLAAVVVLGCQSERLIYYCTLLLLIQLFILGFKVVYARLKYPETHSIRLFRFDVGLLREMLPFLGWNTLEACSWLGKNQGVAVLMNRFYGTVVNAAYGVANQINGPILFFSSTLLNAIRPQIYKSAGAGDNERMVRLSMMASKFAFMSLLCFFLPLSFLISDILTLWLTHVPDYSARFSVLILTVTLISYLSIGVNIAIQAHGNVRLYQLVASIIILVSLPIGYSIYALSKDVYLFLYMMIGVELISVFSKYFIASRILSVRMISFIKEIVWPCMKVVVVLLPVNYLLVILKDSIGGFMGALLFLFLDFLFILLVEFYIGINGAERQMFLRIYQSLLSKFKHK